MFLHMRLDQVYNVTPCGKAAPLELRWPESDAVMPEELSSMPLVAVGRWENMVTLNVGAVCV
jgi:hypothetical protein